MEKIYTEQVLAKFDQIQKKLCGPDMFMEQMHTMGLEKKDQK